MKRVAVLAAAVSFALLAAGCRSRQQDAVAAALNADRAAHHLARLQPSDVLDLKAQAWAEKLARDGQLQHSNLAAGVSGCWKRLAENVGYGSDVASVQLQFMDSAEHRANLLDPGFDLVGVGSARSADGRYWTVQLFEQTC